MSQVSDITLKSYFEPGDQPTANQFADLIDSKPNVADIILSQLGLNITGPGYEALGNGSADDFAAWNQANTDLHAAGGGVIYAPYGKTFRIADDLEFDDDVFIYLEPGTLLSPAVGVTLSNVQLANPIRTEKFTGSGTVTLKPGTIHYPEWWGAKADNTKPDSDVGINKAITSCSLVGGKVEGDIGTYLAAAPIIQKSGVDFYGQGDDTVIQGTFTDSVNCLIKTVDDTGVRTENIKIRRMRLQAGDNALSSFGVRLYRASHVVLSELSMYAENNKNCLIDLYTGNRDVVVEKCYTEESSGVACRGGNSTNSYDDSYKIRIFNNNCNSTLDEAIAIFAWIGNLSDVIVDNNHVNQGDASSHGILVCASLTDDAQATARASAITVSNNTVRSDGNGILIASGHSSAILDGAIISTNHVWGNGAPTLKQGIVMLYPSGVTAGSRGVEIVNNDIHKFREAIYANPKNVAGVLITDPAPIVNGNTILDCGALTYYAISALYASDNKFYNITGTPLLYYAGGQAKGNLLDGTPLMEMRGPVLSMVLTKNAIDDNSATPIFTITQTDQGGLNDGGAFSVNVEGTVGHLGTPNPYSSAANAAVMKFKGSFSRAMTRDVGTGGVNGSLEDTFSGTVVASSAGQMSIATITLTVAETSELVQTVSITVDISGAAAGKSYLGCEIKVFFVGFLTPPVLAAV